MLFSFLFGLGLLRDATSQRHRYAARPISLYMLLFGKKEDKRQPRRAHLATHVSLLPDSVGWRRRHSHDDAPGGAGATWSRGGLERDAGLAAQQLK